DGLGAPLRADPHWRARLRAVHGNSSRGHLGPPGSPRPLAARAPTNDPGPDDRTPATGGEWPLRVAHPSVLRAAARSRLVAVRSGGGALRTRPLGERATSPRR